jgi:hypothetical protein
MEGRYYLINKPTFSGQPGPNPNLEIMEESSPTVLIFSMYFLTVGYLKKFNQKLIDKINNK